MPEKYKHMLELLPFMLSTEKGMPHMNTTRLLEVAFLAGVLWVTIQDLKGDLADMKVRHQRQTETIAVNVAEVRRSMHTIQLKQERFRVLIDEVAIASRKPGIKP